MTKPPPRYLPERPFPPYAHVLGQTPHPTRDPQGHSHGENVEAPDPPEPENWRACPDYLYGIDLFNHGFYWEAHEIWEGLWVACGRRGPTATFLQALINLAAAGFKARSGSARGMRANAGTAARLFKSLARHLESREARYMGLDHRALLEYASAIAHSRETAKTDPGGESLSAFDLVLLPE